ncbi:Charged multivesicular body protein 4b [Microtus ochrogaster]|uniref:Charged multivesicular body protein 4b n=1 Tax=Microtus ochrogaster TaxID=79684 RepID=A0A8J6G0L8_MICOH|nr:Charged multivesicular body protein 4b [Microtus ochrogaster]
MKVLGKLFGAGGAKGSKSSPTPPGGHPAALGRDSEKMLSKKQEFLKKSIKQELTAAKKLSMKNKWVTLKALKPKKRFKKHLAPSGLPGDVYEARCAAVG